MATTAARALPSPPAGGWVALAESNEAAVYEALVRRAGLPAFEVRRHAGGVCLRSPALPTVVVVNRVIGLGVHGAVDERLLEGLLADYGASGFGIELAEPRCSAPVLAWLKARRFRRITQSQVVACEVTPSGGRGRYDTWARSTGLRVERAGPGQGATLARLCSENFKVPPLLAELVRAGTEAPGWRRWLAFDGDEPVGASLSCVHDGCGWFGWTSVNPSHRGRWIHAGFVARQFEDAADAGCRWITTDTAHSTRERPDPVYLNLKRFGFFDVYARPLFVRAPLRQQG